MGGSSDLALDVRWEGEPWDDASVKRNQSQHLRTFVDVRNRSFGSNTTYHPSEMLLIVLGGALNRCNAVHGSKLCSSLESVDSELTGMVVTYSDVLLKGFLHNI
jgi:hypothetical protein